MVKQVLLAALIGGAAFAQTDSDRRIAELEQALGRKTLELEIAKKVSSIWHSAGNANGR